MDRRDFIKKTVLAGSGFVLGQTPFRWLRADTQEWDCIVLGAGIAGLAAARNLTFPQNGKRPLKTLVLEGSNRIGGRIFTNHEFSKGPIELGAEFIHMMPDSVPLWDEVNRYQLATRTIPKMAGITFFHSDLKSFRGSAVDIALSMGLWNAMTMMGKIGGYKGPDISAKEWIASQHLGSHLYEDMLAMSFIGHLPASLDELSVRGFNSDHYSEQLIEFNDYYVTSGFDSLVRNIANQIPIETNSPVESVKYDNRGAEIRCVDGRIFCAKTAICTFSIGMLKSGRVKFDPGLPDTKLAALEHLGIGPITKFTMAFEKKFWPEDITMIQFPDRNRSAGKTFFHVSYGRANEAILTAFLTGDDSRKVSSLADDQLFDLISKDLEKMYPAAGPIKILMKTNADGSLRVLRKSWINDPFALGAYSFPKVLPNPLIEIEQARPLLAQPDTGPMFWAGEATSTDTQPSCVHGAHLSGIRSALQVQSFLETGAPMALSEFSKKYQLWKFKKLSHLKREALANVPDTLF